MCKISVIIPVYNVEQYINRCLKSLEDQTMKDYEVLVINDGSRENEKEIIKKYLGRNKNFFYFEKENGGQASARNYGIRKAKGDYILFLDGDDSLEENALQTLYEATLNKESDIVLCDGYFVEGNEKKYFKTHYNYTKDLNKTYLLNACSPCFKLISRKIFLHEDTFFLEGKIYEDLASVGTYLLYADKISYLEIPLYNYTIRQGSTMNKIKYDEKLADIFDAVDNLRRIFTYHNRYMEFQEEFEFIYIMRLLHDASLRFFEFIQGRQYNEKIADIMKKEYPQWRKNRYYKMQGRKYKIVCELFARKWYFLLGIILKRGRK